MIRNIVTKARAMLIDSKLEDEFWAEAVSTAVYLQARTPSQSIGGTTPYDKLKGKKPELGHLRRFGCAAFKFIPKELRKGKFAERSTECIFLGYVHDTSKIWRLWDPQSSRVIEASDIVFDEHRVLGTPDVNSGEIEILRSWVSENMPPEEDSGVLYPPGVLSSRQALPALEEVTGLIEQRAPTSSCVRVEDSGFKGTRECTNSDLEIEFDQSTPCPVTTVDRCDEASPAGSLRLEEPSQVPKIINLPRSQTVVARGHPGAHSAIHAMIGFGAVDNTEVDPTSYRDSLRSGYCQECKTAMQEEFKTFEDNQTWSIVERSSIGHSAHPIGCKWVFRTKRNPDKSICFKA